MKERILDTKNHVNDVSTNLITMEFLYFGEKRRYPMNKDKLIKWINEEIEKYQGGGMRDAARVDELQKALRYIKSQPEEPI